MRTNNLNDGKNKAIENQKFIGFSKEDVKKIFKEIDEEYCIESFVDKEEAINKIIELKCDKEKIIEWVENTI